MHHQHVIERLNYGEFAPKDVDALSMDLGLSPVDVADFIALSVATGFLGGSLSWQVGDTTMLRLFEWAYHENGPGLSDFAWLVYSAFVIGEERHAGQPPSAGADFFSVPLLQLACRKSPSLPPSILH